MGGGVLRYGFTLTIFLRLLIQGPPYLTRNLISTKLELHPDKYSHGPKYNKTPIFETRMPFRRVWVKGTRHPETF